MPKPLDCTSFPTADEPWHAVKIEQMRAEQVIKQISVLVGFSAKSLETSGPIETADYTVVAQCID